MASLFARTKWFSLPTLLLLLELFTINLSTADAQIGVCYGMIGDNLPPANEVVPLRNSGIELTLGVLQQDLQGLATNASIAQQWVQSNVLNFWPSVKIKYVVVGNEIDPVGSSSQFAQYVLPAIQNTYQAIRAQGLHDLIKVTTAISMDLLGNSYTPSQNYFKPDVRSYIDPIIGYLFPMLFSTNVVVWDGQYGYQNLFDATLDAVLVAIDNTGIGYVEVVVSESG
ncbi:Glucan endo-1,3-beta-glucosidase [Glycine soja]|uniref:glucan endo-1,3-beta-D-glucosidase n=1 Tax=Glycine soja TaxID=3848 RepID=A0A0B2PZY6_GLYSO|nr:Glucan endo-1,3-beta-glucosidase [Glycine soja]